MKFTRSVQKSRTVVKLVMPLIIVNSNVRSTEYAGFRHFDDSAAVLSHGQRQGLRIVKHDLNPTHVSTREDKSIVWFTPAVDGNDHY